MCAAQLAVGLV